VFLKVFDFEPDSVEAKNRVIEFGGGEKREVEDKVKRAWCG
jgi:hypothetical protein